MAVTVAVQNDTSAGARGGMITHDDADDIAIREGGALLVYKHNRGSDTTIAAYGPGFWVSATVDSA